MNKNSAGRIKRNQTTDNEKFHMSNRKYSGKPQEQPGETEERISSQKMNTWKTLKQKNKNQNKDR